MTAQKRAKIDPALGLDLVQSRTLANRDATVAVVIPAHNEQGTIAEVVGDAHQALTLLETEGEVIVSASGCTDDTANIASDSGAKVIEAPAGKGLAMLAGIQASRADIVCLIDGDLRYYGDEPLAAALVSPILKGISDATIADLYWRPLYPQLWLHGFFAPLAGKLFPELLPKTGSTPWSGQRAALRKYWPTELPDGFTSDLAILLHWNDLGISLRPVLADDWVNPQRPKPDLMRQEFSLLVDHAVRLGRISETEVAKLETWFTTAHNLMAEYKPDDDDPQEFEGSLLKRSLAALD
ncbi:glycosyltransferase [Nocardiopsis sp. NPDC049922]|uniref:glycosyltransferase n=1 Tax=Nocardiopsis sp. NPDC049922 TaxID=3155157 RepID=UPI0033D10B22